MKKIILFVALCLVTVAIYLYSKPSKIEHAIKLVSKNQIEKISEYLLKYQQLHGDFPAEDYWFTTLDESIDFNEQFLQDVSMNELPMDPWNNPYHYIYPGKVNKSSFDLWSNGADGVVGGTGENRDIGNW